MMVEPSWVTEPWDPDVDPTKRALKGAGLAGRYCEPSFGLDAIGELSTGASAMLLTLRTGDYEDLANGRGLVLRSASNNLTLSTDCLCYVVRESVLHEISSMYFASPAALCGAMRADQDEPWAVQFLAINKFNRNGECPVSARERYDVADLIERRFLNGKSTAVSLQTSTDWWWPDDLADLIREDGRFASFVL